jgi:hypothetical protein
MFYRVQVTPQVAISPTLQVVIDFFNDPATTEIYTLGIRTRLAF